MEDKHTEAFYALWAASSSVLKARQALVLPRRLRQYHASAAIT